MPEQPHKAAASRVPAVLCYLLSAYAGVVALGLVIALNFSERLGGLGATRYQPLFALMGAHGAATLIAFVAGTLLGKYPVRAAWLTRLMLLISIAATIVSSDLLMGLIYPPPLPTRSLFELHERRGWTHKPFAFEHGRDTSVGDADTQLDGHGLRVDYGVPICEITGNNRILFIGDSVTFGYDVQASETFCARTEQLLRKRHPAAGIQCLNFGITGYDLHQELDLLTHEGFDLSPKIVVLSICLNDVTKQFDARAGADQARHREFSKAQAHTHWSGWVRAILAWTRRYQFGDDERATAAAFEHFEFNELLESPHSPKVEEAWRRLFNDLDQIVAACRERKLPLIVLGFPIRPQIAAGIGFEPQERLRRHLNGKSVTFIDMTDAFLENEMQSESLAQRMFIDPTHPTPLGHERVARKLYEAIEREKLVLKYLLN